MSLLLQLYAWLNLNFCTVEITKLVVRFSIVGGGLLRVVWLAILLNPFRSKRKIFMAGFSAAN